MRTTCVRYDFAHADGPTELEDFYTYMYECLQEFQDFDIADISAFWIVTSNARLAQSCRGLGIDEILMIRNGKGLEINVQLAYGTASS